MKYFFCILAFFIGLRGNTQVFSFLDTSTTLVKTVNQSPAHWYLEIDNLTGVDTALRWKCIEVNAPTAWSFSFDDQNTYYSTVQVGDSADFTLYTPGSFPQKLIIGADLNGVSGNGYIRFKVWNPENPNEAQIISYYFEISPISTIQEEINKYLIFSETQIEWQLGASTRLTVYDWSGRLIKSGMQSISMENIPPGNYLLEIRSASESYWVKWIKN